MRPALVAPSEKGVPRAHRPVPPHAADAGFRAASPLAKIPAIDEGGFRRADARALHDVERPHPAPALVPAEPRASARAPWFDESADTACVPRMTVPFRRGSSSRGCSTGRATRRWRGARSRGAPPLFDHLEAQIDGPYLAGGAFSIADIAAAAPFQNLRKVEPDPRCWLRLAARDRGHAVTAVLRRRGRRGQGLRRAARRGRARPIRASVRWCPSSGSVPAAISIRAPREGATLVTASVRIAVLGFRSTPP